MPTSAFLGEWEQLVLLAILRQRDAAYVIGLRSHLTGVMGRTPSRGALYRTLDRLEEKGYVSSAFSDPTPERGGRSKRYFRINPLGMRTLRASREALTAMWEGLELRVQRGS